MWDGDEKATTKTSGKKKSNVKNLNLWNREPFLDPRLQGNQRVSGFVEGNYLQMISVYTKAVVASEANPCEIKDAQKCETNHYGVDGNDQRLVISEQTTEAGREGGRREVATWGG